MAKKKNTNYVNQPLLKPQEVQNVQVNYMTELETNPQYSLDVDPTNKYNMDDEMKKFVKLYIEFRSIPATREIMQIPIEKAMVYFNSYPVQQEIRRINMALYQRRFASKILDMDQLGGYLSTLLIDENVPIADRLNSKDKLEVVNMLMKINQEKAKAIENPAIIMGKDIDIQIKELSIGTIEQLLRQSNKVEDNKDRIEIVAEIDKDNVLSMEEKSYLETLPTDQLLKMIDETNKNEEGGQNE